MPLPRLVATVAATVAVSAATVTGTAAPARADTRGAMIWGGTALELSTLGVFALNFGTDLVPNHGPGMIINFTPMVIAPAVGYGARNADPALPLAIHGAGWMGVDLFLLGTLIDGRGERDRMRVGAVAWTLGAVGAVAGGVLSTRVDPGTETTAFMAAPPAGFAAGGLVLGGILVLAGGLDGDKAVSQFATGATIGLTLGLGAATYLALRDDGGDGGALAHTARLPAPRLEPGRDRFVVSVGGSF